MRDWIWRVVYRVGFRVLRFTWRFRHPRQHGALAAIWHDGRVLAVRQSYRDGLTFPGGTVRAREAAIDAVCRELCEELGLAVSPGQLSLTHDVVHDWEWRRDHVQVFDLHLRAEPVLRIDNREIVAARFMRPGEMLRSPVPPHIRSYLGSRDGTPA